MNKALAYLEQFAPEADAWFKRTTFVRENYEFFRNFFKLENLEKAEWADIQKIGQHLHCFNSIALARTRALGNRNHSIEHYRKSFIYLAHGPGEPAERIRLFCNDKEYRLKYFGKSAVSELIGYLFPDQFLFANARDEFAVRFLGIQVQKNASDDLVSELQAFSNAARPLVLQYQEIVGKQTDLPLLLELDQFFSWLYKNFAGKEQIEPLPSASQQYWTFSAGRDGDHWKEFYEKGIMAIGWDGTPDLRQFKNKGEIRQQLLKLYPSESSKVNDTRACWQFVHDIKKGDIIFAKQGLSKILGYGVVQGEYIFDSQRSQFKHVRQVKWIAKGEWEMPEDSKMAVKTLTNITPYPDFVSLIAEKIGLDLGHEKEPGKEPLPPVGIAYWWLNANPKIWDFEETPVGEKQTYTSRNDQGNKRQKYKYFQEVKPGDIVVGYVTSPQKEVVGVCKITQGLYQTNKGEEIEFEKIEQLATPIPYERLRAHPDLIDSEPLVNNQGSLFKLTELEYEIIRSLIDESNIPLKIELKSYTKQVAMEGLFLSEDQFDEILNALKEKKNVVLQGPPGVGKTYIAKRLAYTLIGSNDPRQVEMIQFHQSYSYEDFIQGFRPTAKGHFDLKYGVFYQFCRRAQREELQQRPYVFIIDEINRGNLSKIFGELMMLIEPDKRGKDHSIPLAYSEDADERFFIPENLHLIGMMNTADRSLAMVDYALRRRFRFITLRPEFASEAFKQYLVAAGAGAELVKKIVSRMAALNEVISEDTKNLGSGYQIGHSYFCPRNGITPDETWYRRVIEAEIVPLIQEYWFDNEQKVKEQRSALLA